DKEEEKIAEAKCADEFGHESGTGRRALAKGIITGDWKRSTGIWRKIERRRHETEQEDKKRKKRSQAAKRVERSGIVNGRDAKETHAEKKDSPHEIGRASCRERG